MRDQPHPRRSLFKLGNCLFLLILCKPTWKKKKQREIQELLWEGSVAKKASGGRWDWNSSKENIGVILESFLPEGSVGAKFCISPKWSQQLQHIICGNSFRIWKGFQSHAGSCLLSPHSVIIGPLVPFIELFSPNKTLNAGLSNCSRITSCTPPSLFLLAPTCLFFSGHSGALCKLLQRGPVAALALAWLTQAPPSPTPPGLNSHPFPAIFWAATLKLGNHPKYMKAHEKHKLP